jgi:dTDP-4-amino-4,6-dideoxygalactose transaminase
MIVQFFDLKAQYQSIKSSLEGTLTNAIQSFQFLKGPQLGEFERKFADLLGSRYCVSTGNGTDSLYLILKALGIEPGDEVITPSWSWISTAETISLCGATPVFADVDDLYYTIDPASIKQRITSKTRAIIVVHLYGQAAAVDEIMAICKEHGLYLIEDCAQAHLTEYQGKYTGSFGNAAAFSFYPTKNLGAYGDAGCVVCNDQAMAEKIRRLANHGALFKDDHAFEGINSRMDTIQAAVLLAKLPFLQGWNDSRRKHAALYSQLLADLPEIQTPLIRPYTEHTFHIYAVQAQQRDKLKEYLQNRGIQTMIHYPKALVNLPPYRPLKTTDFPVSERLEQTILSLPIYPELTEAQIHYVCDNIRAFYLQ